MLLSQDLPIILTLLSAAVTAILAGSLLLPRGQIMISEAASHAVLPGLIIGFALSGDHGWQVLLGAIVTIALFVGGVSWLRTQESWLMRCWAPLLLHLVSNTCMHICANLRVN